MTRTELLETWRERLDDHEISEMTVQDWCDFNRVSPYQFYYWKRKIAARAAAPAIPSSLAKPNSFVPLRIIDENPSHDTLTIHVAGADIRIAPGFDPALLRAVVQALAVRPC